MKNVTIIVSLLIMLGSCKTEDSSEINDLRNKTKSAYLPMKIGNYWVYQNFSIDANGIEHQTTGLDSIAIIKDTIINGVLFCRADNYFCTTQNQSPIFNSKNYLRDSSGYLIDYTGNILFSETNFTDTIYRYMETFQSDTLCWLTYKMEKSDRQFNLPFVHNNDVLCFKGTVIANPKFCTIQNPRYTNAYYAKGVGKIAYSFIYLFGGGGIEKRLIRYHLNQ